MEDIPIADLVLVHLADAADAFDDRTTSAISDALNCGAAVSTRIELLSTIADLREAGLIEERTLDTETGGSTAYALTEEGRERAATPLDRLREESVDIDREDDRRTVSLELAKRRTGAASLAAVVARATDGVLRVGEVDSDAFINRSAELRRIESALEDCDRGAVDAIRIIGERGIGKSDLLEQLESAAADRGFEVFAATARDDVPAPYRPVREALPASVAAELFEGASLDADDDALEERRTGFFFSVTEALATHIDAETTLLVLDDFHAAGSDTRALVRHLSEHRPEGLILVTALRPETAEGDGPDPLATVPESRRVDLHVDPLDPEATRELVAALLGSQDVPQAFVDDLHELTGGNPLFVEETVATLREEGRVDPSTKLYPQAGADLPIPDRVQATIGTRVARLEGTVRDLIEHGAVIGLAVPVDVLEAAVSYEGSTVREYVDFLVDTRFWEREDGTIRFASDVVRDVVLDGLDEERRRELHEHVADAYTILDDDREDGFAVARHAELAGDEERALEAYRAAGERAIGVYAFETALEGYERALRLARSLDRQADLVALLDDIATLHSIAGNYDEADKYLTFLRESTDDPESLQRSYHIQAEMRYNEGKHDAGLDAAERGLEVGDEVTEETARLYGVSGWIRMLQGDIDDALADYERQLAVADELDHDGQRAHAKHTLASAAFIRGDIETGIERERESIAARQSLDNDRRLASSYNNLGVMYLRTGDLDSARAAIERGVDLAETVGDPLGQVSFEGNLAYCLERQGEWDRALELYAETLETAETLGARPTIGFVLGYGSVIPCYRGDLPGARERLDRALAVNESIDHMRQLAMVRNKLAWVETLRGTLDEAVDHAERARELAAGEEPEWVAEARLRLARVSMARGAVDDAIEHYETGLETARECESARMQAANAAGLGVALAESGDTGDGIETARDAVDRAQRVGEPALIASTRCSLARCLRLGGAKGAVAELDAATDIARQLEATVLECQALLERGRLGPEEGDEDPRGDLERARELAEEAGAELLVQRAADALGALAESR